MKLTNGFEYKTIVDLEPYLIKLTNNNFFNKYKCTIKIKSSDLYECIQNTFIENLDRNGTEYIFETLEGLMVNAHSFVSENYYTIKYYDNFNREFFIEKNFYYGKIISEIYKCDNKLHRNGAPAVIRYKSDGTVRTNIYYFHGKEVRKNKFNKILEKLNKFEAKNVKRYKLNSLIELDNIAMDYDNVKIHEILKREIELRLIIEKMEGKDETY